MREFRMPKLALGEGDRMTVLEWLLAEGAEFNEGEILLEVETDKASMEVDAPFDGVLARIVRQESEGVEPGELLAWVADPGEEYDRAQLSPEEEEARASDGEAPIATAPAPAQGVRDEPRSIALADPALQGDLRGLPTTRAPVARTPPGQPTSALDPEGENAGAYETVSLSRHRLAVTRAMERSNQIPQFAVFREIGVDAAIRALERIREERADATLSDLILLATARALVSHPEINAWFGEEEMLRFEQVNIALAVDGPDGVVGPVVRAVQNLGLNALVEERARLVHAAREGRIRRSDIQGGTFTLSNIGPLAADGLLPMLTPPQVAILALGRVRDSGGRRMATATLAGDHRAIDGADGARFLQTLNRELELLNSQGAPGAGNAKSTDGGTT